MIIKHAATMVASVTLLLASTLVMADEGTRTELKRADLPDAPGMEVIASVTEYQPGETLKRHLHHGTESGYVIQGAQVQAEGKEPVMLPTGAAVLYQRDVPHGGFKVIGDTSLKIYAVHIVDKDKPVYEWLAR